MRSIISVLALSVLLGGFLPATAADSHSDPLQVAIEGDWRKTEDRARDRWRHPYETLHFFGIQPNLTVVELWPGGGWYADILAPYLHDEGRYIAAHFHPQTEHRFADFMARSYQEFVDRSEDSSDALSGATVLAFEPPAANDLPADGSVDMVLTFRNAHNWMRDGNLEAVLAAVHDALRPGGVFGVVDHRAAAEAEIDPEARNGYVNTGYMIEQIEAAGFTLVGQSEVNANPADSASHPNGVWTLPPRSNVPEGEDPTSYQAIGESDRFTLKFVKDVRREG